MFENIKSRALILSLELKHFKNEKTGEVRDMTLVKYIVSTPTTEDFKGGSLLEAYTTADAFTKLDKLLLQNCEITLSQKPTTNGTKYVLISVNNIELKK